MPKQNPALRPLNSRKAIVAKVMDPRVTNLGSIGEAFVTAARKAAI